MSAGICYDIDIASADRWRFGERSKMNRAVVAVFSLAWPAVALAERQPPLELTAPAEIEEAKALNAGIDRISGTVTPCVEKGGDPTACLCRNAADLAALRGAYQATVAKHPAWRGRTLFFSNAERSYSWDISMPGLERALSGCP